MLGLCSKSEKPQTKSCIMLVSCTCFMVWDLFAQQTGESTTVCGVVATGLLWLTHFKWDLEGVKGRDCIRSGDTAPKATPAIWVACFKQSSITVAFKKMKHSSQLHPEKSKSTYAFPRLGTLSVMFLVIFIYQNSGMMGNLSFHSMHLGLSSEAKYPPLGGAQWRGEQECSRDGSSERVFTVMRSRQEELWAAIVVHRFALDSCLTPAGYSPMNI